MKQQYTNPFFIFFLMLPAGISIGFVTVALPYLLTKQNGFSVAETGVIVSIGVSANLWRFVWGPITDLTLSLRKWFWIGVAACVATLMLLCFTPFTTQGAVLLTSVVFISQIAATFITLPIGGFMANRIEPSKKGRGGGWYQAGNLGGVGLGGGAGLWLATHYNVAISGIVLSGASILSAIVVQLIEDVKRNEQKSFLQEMTGMGKDVVSMLRVPVVLFIIIMLCMPIGTGAAANLWSAIASDWHTDSDDIALVSGVLSGVVSSIGCLLGGYVADRWGNFGAYLGAGTVGALVAAAMAFSPYSPAVFISGVLGYIFGLGLMNAAFSSIILFAIGKKNASTNYALLSSLGNVPVVYMTAIDGWAHDKFNSKFMLLSEAAVCMVFVFICLAILQMMNTKKLLQNTIDN